MPRKGYVPRRESAADPKYDSVLVTRFINAIMGGGKRSIAEGHFYKAMTMIEEKSGQEGQIGTIRQEAADTERGHSHDHG